MMWAAPVSLLAVGLLPFWPAVFFDVAAQPRADRCEQCGACIVQCPTDALAFTNPDGERVPPEAIRRYKLNLLARRD